MTDPRNGETPNFQAENAPDSYQVNGATHFLNDWEKTAYAMGYNKANDLAHPPAPDDDRRRALEEMGRYDPYSKEWTEAVYKNFRTIRAALLAVQPPSEAERAEEDAMIADLHASNAKWFKRATDCANELAQLRAALEPLVEARKKATAGEWVRETDPDDVYSRRIKAGTKTVTDTRFTNGNNDNAFICASANTIAEIAPLIEKEKQS